MRAKYIALGLTVVLAFYLVVMGDRGIRLIATGEVVGVLLGVGVLILPLLGGWAIWRELQFGAASQRLGRQLGDEGGLPPDDLPRHPSGRVDRRGTDEIFDRYRAETEAAPEDWRSWYRLGLAYDASGDRGRARGAIRHAIALYSE